MEKNRNNHRNIISRLLEMNYSVKFSLLAVFVEGKMKKKVGIVNILLSLYFSSNVVLDLLKMLDAFRQ